MFDLYVGILRGQKVSFPWSWSYYIGCCQLPRVGARNPTQFSARTVSAFNSGALSPCSPLLSLNLPSVILCFSSS